MNKINRTAISRLLCHMQHLHIPFTALNWSLRSLSTRPINCLQTHQYAATATPTFLASLSPLSYNACSESFSAWGLPTWSHLHPESTLVYCFGRGLFPKDTPRVWFPMAEVLVKFLSRTCLQNKGWVNGSGIGQPGGSWKGRFYFCLCWKFIFFTAVKNLNQLQFYRKDKLPHPDNLYPSL